VNTETRYEGLLNVAHCALGGKEGGTGEPKVGKVSLCTP
jgi:hypothetical protein